MVPALAAHIQSLAALALAADSLEWLSLGGWMEPSKLSCRKLRSLSLAGLPKNLEAIEALTGLDESSLEIDAKLGKRAVNVFGTKDEKIILS